MPERNDEHMKRCATCKHWTPNTERTGFGNVVSFRGQGDHVAARAKSDEADMLFGECRKINLEAALDLEMDAPIPLAVARDGSDYRAEVYTRAEFGCVLHEERP